MNDLMKLVWLVRDRTFRSTSHKQVAYALAARANSELALWPSQAAIADDTALSIRTVIRVLADFEKDCLIERHSRYGGKRIRSSDMIMINFDEIERLPETVSARGRRLHDTVSNLPDTECRATCHGVTVSNTRSKQRRKSRAIVVSRPKEFA